MTGSMGGGRVTTFPPYSDITNIEYNSGMMSGVLEVLTPPSYQGTANHDYWRSASTSRNKAGDSPPFTLSNCLPLPPKAQHKLALPRLTELQKKIIDYKRPTFHVQHSPSAAAAPSTSLAEELHNLADLHHQGILDDAEFAAAKQATIARHSNS